MDGIESTKLSWSENLINSDISSKQSKLLFKFRTRIYPVKTNFRSQNENDLACSMCPYSEYSQPHLYVCPVIKAFIPELIDTPIKYDDILGNTDQMKKVVLLLEKICKIRKQILEDIQ